MTDEQIKAIEQLLDCTFFKCNRRTNWYAFRENKHYRIVINFNVGDKFVGHYAATAATSYTLIPFSFEEMKNIVKACEQVLEW